MAAADVSTPPPAPPRRGVQLPGWLAVLLVVLAAAGAAYAGWRLLRPTPVADLSQFESNDTGGGRPGRGNRGPADAAEGITLRPDGGGTVRSGGFVVQFLPGAKTTLLARDRVPSTPTDAAVLQARLKALGDAAVRKRFGISDEQAAKLRRVNTAVPPAVDAQTRAALLGLWAGLRAAPPEAKPAAEKAVLDAVTAAAARHHDAATAASRAAADEVRAILPPDVIKKFR